MKRLRTLALAVTPRRARPHRLQHRVHRQRRRRPSAAPRPRPTPSPSPSSTPSARPRSRRSRSGSRPSAGATRTTRWPSAWCRSAPPRSPGAATRPAPRTGSTPSSRSWAARRRRGTTTPTASPSTRSPSSSPDLILATNSGHHRGRSTRSSPRSPRSSPTPRRRGSPRGRPRWRWSARRWAAPTRPRRSRRRPRRRSTAAKEEYPQMDGQVVHLRLPLHHRPLHDRHLRAAGPAGLVPARPRPGGRPVGRRGRSSRVSSTAPSPPSEAAALDSDVFAHLDGGPGRHGDVRRRPAGRQDPGDRRRARLRRGGQARSASAVTNPTPLSIPVVIERVRARGGAGRRQGS